MKTNDEFDIVEKIKEACLILNDVDAYISGLNDKHSRIDLQLSDLYHTYEKEKIETWTENGLRNLAYEVQRVTTLRRKIKKDIGLMKVYQDNIGKLNNISNRNMLLEKLYKANKNDVDDYKYRVYTEEEINKIIGIMNKPIDTIESNDLE